MGLFQNPELFRDSSDAVIFTALKSAYTGPKTPSSDPSTGMGEVHF